MISEGHKRNFETLKRAAADGNLALMECTDAKTSEVRIVICAVSQVHDEYVMTPFGHLCNGNPYEEYLPPMETAA